MNSTQQQQQLQNLLRPDHVPNLHHLPVEQKGKYEQGLRQLWERINSAPPDSPEYQSALIQLRKVSTKAREELRSWNQSQNQQNAHQASQQTARPSSRGQQVQPAHSSVSQTHQQQQPAAAVQSQHQLPPSFVQRSQQIPITLPPHMTPGTPEAERFTLETRSRYSQASYQKALGLERLKQIKSLIEQRKGQDISAEVLAQKATAENSLAKASAILDDFRRKQQQYQAQRSQSQEGESHMNMSGTPMINPAGAQHTYTSQQGPHQNRQAVQSTVPSAHTLNSALETRNQAYATDVASPSPAASGQAQGPQAHPAEIQPNPNSQGPATANLHQQFQQQQPQQQSNFNLSRPPQAQQQLQQQQPPYPVTTHQSSAQAGAPQSNNLQSQPLPLSRQAAMSAAANAYAEQRGTPQSAISQAHPQTGHREDGALGSRFQIPNRLNVPSPRPVNIGPARPTLSGPNNGVPGVMGQPAIPKMPQFMLEGDGDRVLSKKKLDELVRQVTGAGGGPLGEGLTPEVEEAMLILADEFVDNVITQACRMAKARESNMLEIRDIQHVLERTYNIRVPGYASDEIRTVRKFQPAAGWTQKMNAVQAAKVMGGRNE